MVDLATLQNAGDSTIPGLSSDIQNVQSSLNTYETQYGPIVSQTYQIGKVSADAIASGSGPAWHNVVSMAQNNADLKALADATSVSNAKAAAAVGAVATTIATAIGAAIGMPYLGAAVAALFSYIGANPAKAGPGLCATDPPPSSSPADLRGWAHYVNPSSQFGIQQSSWGAPNSFEYMANALLFHTQELISNCFAITYDENGNVTGTFTLAGTLPNIIGVWNAAHQGPTRVITRSGLNRWNGLVNLPANAPNDWIAQALQNNTDSDQASFVINDGPPIARKTVILHLASRGVTPPAASGTIISSSSTSSASASVAKKVIVGTAIAAGAGAAGLGVWAFLTHQSFLGAAKALFGHAVATVNPLPAVALETIKPTKVQTLLFPRPKFSGQRALDWAASHGYKARKVDFKPHYVHVRQRPPSAFVKGSLRTVELGDSGIHAIVGHLR